MKITLLYFDGCPSWRAAMTNLREALSAEDVEADIELVKVEDDEAAARWKFLGSPSFQIYGADLWQEPRQQFNLSCRLYATPQGMRGAPSVEMLRERLRAKRMDARITQLR